jgi:hypothetical protein
MKPGMMGPGGPVTEKEKCEWMEGGFYLLWHLEYTGAIGERAGLSMRGYSVDDKVYTYPAFDSFGEFEDSKGTFHEETGRWTTETKMGGLTMKSRFTMKMNSATSYNFAHETSPDGTRWTTVIDGTGTKKWIVAELKLISCNNPSGLYDLALTSCAADEDIRKQRIDRARRIDVWK